jgi:hypothetical protein
MRRRIMPLPYEEEDTCLCHMRRRIHAYSSASLSTCAQFVLKLVPAQHEHARASSLCAHRG